MSLCTLLHELVHESCSCQTSPVGSGPINRSTKSGEETNHQTLGFLGHLFKDLFWVRVLNHQIYIHKDYQVRSQWVTFHRPRTTDRNVAEETSGSVGQTVGCITVLRKNQIIYCGSPCINLQPSDHYVLSEWLEYTPWHCRFFLGGLIHEKPSRKIADVFFKANENQSFGRWPTFCQDTLIGEVEIQCCRTMRKATTANCPPSSSVDHSTDSQFGNQRCPVYSRNCPQSQSKAGKLQNTNSSCHLISELTVTIQYSK